MYDFILILKKPLFFFAILCSDTQVSMPRIPRAKEPAVDQDIATRRPIPVESLIELGRFQW